MYFEVIGKVDKIKLERKKKKRNEEGKRKKKRKKSDKGKNCNE